MNTRLEIASRLMAGLSANANYTLGPPNDEVLRLADALIAEEARTRRGMTDDEINEAMAKDPAAYRCPCSFQHPPHDNCDGNPRAVFSRSSPPPVPNAPAPDDLRAVAEEMCAALVVAQTRLNFRLVGDDYHAAMRRLGCGGGERTDDFCDRVLAAALARARALGLGGGK